MLSMVAHGVEMLVETEAGDKQLSGGCRLVQNCLTGGMVSPSSLPSLLYFAA